MSTQTLTNPAPANRILPSEQREMDDLIRFAEQRLAAVKTPPSFHPRNKENLSDARA